jgi:hypothetical protein
MNLEQAALREEGAAWARQEERDLTTLDRLASLGQNQQAQAMAYGQDATQSLMGGIESGINLGTQLAKQIE